MDAPGKEAYRASYCDEGYFVTLKQLKEVKFGNTVRITKIKSPIVRFGVPKEVNDDPDSWDAFSKIFITSNPANFKKNAQDTLISYIRSDGKPEQKTLTEIFKVIVYS